MEKQKIDIYTDGSCIGNPGPGGWGVIILKDDQEIKLSGCEEHTTNNRMEMTAIINALSWIHTHYENHFNDVEITIYSDSNLLIQSINQGWKRKANLDLWGEMDRLRGWLSITWTWVKAHAKNKYNNEADKIAFNEANKLIKRA